MNIKSEAASGSYYDSWMRIICSDKNCETMNWVELGNLNDYSANDRHAATCWKCGIKFWIDWKIPRYAEDHFDLEHMDESKDLIDQDQIYCVQGREKP